MDMWDAALRIAIILEAILFGGGAITLYVLNYHVWPAPDQMYLGYIVGLGIAGYAAAIASYFVLRDWLGADKPAAQAPPLKG
jgi:hypothetical protein